MRTLLCALLLCCFAVSALAEPAAMTVSSEGVTNGVLADEYGKKGTDFVKGKPSRSMPLTLTHQPDGTACLAIEMTDPDGGDWVHWLAANVPASDEIAENASIELADQMLQGKNSFGLIGYGGPTPPRGTHTYEITVYALSATVELKSGFSQKNFHRAIKDLVLASATLEADYSKD